MSPKKIMTSEEKMQEIMAVLEDKKAVDPVIVEVKGRTVMTDYLIVASGTSQVHIRALAESVSDKLADEGMKNKRIEGYSEGIWILLDYGDVIVHILSPEQREHYRLEAYWSGAEKGSPPTLSP